MPMILHSKEDMCLLPGVLLVVVVVVVVDLISSIAEETGVRTSKMDQPSEQKCQNYFHQYANANTIQNQY